MPMKTITPDTCIKLPLDFYRQQKVVPVAKALLGKILVTNFDGMLTAGRIVETEAYNGETDRASHAWNGRRTNRTEVMYAAGGLAYVYLCYGIHHLFNIVTNTIDIPHAVLIRALEPVAGIETMLARTKKKKADHSLTRGPGNVAKAMGLIVTHTGLSLLDNELFITEDETKIKTSQIVATPRIGVDYAGEDALLPYRFIVKGNPYVSGNAKINKA